MTTGLAIERAQHARRRSLLAPVLVMIVGSIGVLFPVHSSSTRAFAVARYAEVLGDAAVAELSRLTFAETALLQLSVFTVGTGAVWLTTLIVLSWRDSRRGRPPVG